MHQAIEGSELRRHPGRGASCPTSSSRRRSTPRSRASSSIGYSAQCIHEISDFRFQISDWCRAGGVRPCGHRRPRHRTTPTKPLDEIARPVRARRFGVLPGAQAAIGRASTATSTPRVGRIVDGRPRDEQIAFWINAYNAHRAEDGHRSTIRFPQRSKEYPARSIRQMPGAFERNMHRVAGRTRHARSDRADDPRRVRRPARLSGARPRRHRQRPAAQRGLFGRGARAAVDRGRQRMRDAGAVRRYQQVGERGPRQLDFLVAAEGVLGRLRGQGATSCSPAAARSSVPFSPSSRPGC